MSELVEETCHGQDHGISGGCDNMRNMRQILSFSNSIDLLPLDSTITGSIMRRRTRSITILTIMNENYNEIPH